MVDLDDLKKRKKVIKRDAKKTLTRINNLSKDLNRLNLIVADAENILNTLDRKFEAKLKLDKNDVNFLFIAVALQVTRQMLTKFEERTDHVSSGKEAYEQHRGISEQLFDSNSKRKYRYYYATMDEIILNPSVPYDVTKGTKKYDLGNGGNQAKGLSGTNHRVKTLGHDPILGYVFGTCNIMTATLTTNTLKTVHVREGMAINKASTKTMFDYSLKRSKEEPQALCAALVKQYFHIKSDIYSHEGIPLPILSMPFENVVHELNKHGIDFGNVITVGKQASYSILINTLIYYLYVLFNMEKKSVDNGIVRAKALKIIEYSNVIASTSNVIYVAISKDLKNLDVGGLLVTIHSIVKSKSVQQKLKEEFLEKEFSTLVNS